MLITECDATTRAAWQHDNGAQYGFCPRHPSVSLKAGVSGRGQFARTFTYCPACQN